MDGEKVASKKRKTARNRGIIAGVAVCMVILAGVGLAVGPLGTKAPLSETTSVAVQETEADAPEAEAPDAQAPEATAPEEAAEPSDGANGVVESVPLPDEPTYKQDTVLVMLDSTANAGNVTAQLSGLDFLDSPMVTEEDVDNGFAELTLASGCSVESSVPQLQGIEGVEDSQPNYYYYLDEASASGSQSLAAGTGVFEDKKTNDPKAKRQWHLNKKQGINAYRAWNLMKGSKARKRVAVAVLDTGCNYRHKDLKKNIVTMYDATGSHHSGYNDISGHGTHVCGIVAARSGNKKGVSGVTYNAKVLPIQVFHMTYNSGRYVPMADTASLLRAYRFITKNTYKYNIRVANMSLGGYRSTSRPEPTDKALIRAANRAYKAGVLTVCSAGNDADYYGAYYQFPSSYNKRGMNVIAIQKDRTRVYWSNYNHYGERRMDISAPGVGILSTYYDTSWGKSTYKRVDGTSQASPIVAGTAALVFSANQSLMPKQVKKILHKTTTDIGSWGFDVYTGYGEVNAYKAVKYVKKKYRFKTRSKARKRAFDKSTKVKIKNAKRIVYNGKKKRPKVTVLFNGKKKLTKGKHYTVKYKHNRNAGKAKVIVKGKGKYTGTIKKTFKIKKAKQTIKVRTRVAKVSAKKLKRSKRYVRCVKRVTGSKTHKLAYNKIKRYGSKRLTVTKNTGKVIVKKGTKRGSYKIKVRVYSKAGRNYKKSKPVTKVFRVKVTR